MCAASSTARMYRRAPIATTSAPGCARCDCLAAAGCWQPQFCERGPSDACQTNPCAHKQRFLDTSACLLDGRLCGGPGCSSLDAVTRIAGTCKASQSRATRYAETHIGSFSIRAKRISVRGTAKKRNAWQRIATQSNAVRVHLHRVVLIQANRRVVQSNGRHSVGAQSNAVRDHLHRVVLIQRQRSE